MNGRVQTIVDTGSSVLERVPLQDGWSAVPTPPGATDEHLAGLDDAMLPFSVPGTAASALLAAGRPTTADLDDEDWWFRCRFATAPAAAGEEVALRFDGLATFADIWLNGAHVLSSDNMHMSHEIEIGTLLRAENELVIGVRALGPLLEPKRPRPRWRTRLVRNQNLRWIRTALAGRIPAFAPGPAPVGPWRPVTLLRRRHVAVDDLTLRARHDGDAGVVVVAGVLRPLGETQLETVTVRITGPAGAVEAPLDIIERDGRVYAEGSVRIDGAALWWPHTHGTPALHEVELVVSGGGWSASHDCGRVGFRSLEATDEPGLALSLNGVPMFCRGGALLPDAVTVDPTSDRLRQTLERCRDAGMNMIRLSGVGTYGSDDFFAACDELGLLVWQDFPFANLDYPVEDTEFRASVETEVRGFLARAGSHPSLAILCGNSEIEQQVGMLGLDPELGRGPLFGELLPALVRELAVEAHYVTSSPTGGDLPFRPNAGVAHYFGVGAYRRPLDDARRAEVRFAAECLAFANVPDDSLLDGLAPGGAGRLVHTPAWKAGVPRDSGTGWDFDDVRDHYLGSLFGLDPVGLRWADPERYLTLSRIVTGEVMAATLGEWRRLRSTCRGALLWTLNDVLPGAGWGVLDSRGSPKPAYWLVRRALAPVAVWLTDEGTNGVAVHVANDGHRSEPVTLELTLFRSDGLAVESAQRELELAPHSLSELSVEEVLGHFVDAGYAFAFGPPGHDAVVATLRRSSGDVVSQSSLFPAGYPLAVEPISSLGLECSATPGPDGVLVTLRSARLAYGVSVSAEGYLPDDDWLTLAPECERRLRLRPRDAASEWTGGVVSAVNAGGTVRLGRGG